MTDKHGPMIGGLDIRDVAGCTCLRLRRTTRMASRLYDQSLAQIGLTVSQFGILGYLYGALVRTGRGLPITKLAHEIGMDPTSLNRSLKPLLAQGFIDVARDEQDHRVKLLTISKVGRERLARAMPLWKAAQDDLLQRVGRETTIVLNGLLELSDARLSM